jgi:hypothetical protein
MGLVGPGRWRLLSQDGMREHHSREGDAEREGQDCSLHDLLLSKQSPTVCRARADRIYDLSHIAFAAQGRVVAPRKSGEACWITDGDTRPVAGDHPAFLQLGEGARR